MALNVERYVLPKIQGGRGIRRERQESRNAATTGRSRHRHGALQLLLWQPVDHAEISIKASAMDVAVLEVASAQGKTDSDGSYSLDIKLPKYLPDGRSATVPARVLIEATVKDSAGHAETRGEPIMVSESPLLITAVPEGGSAGP